MTRAPRKYSYDDKCEDLAEHFISGDPRARWMIAASLAQAIQDAVESWFAAFPDYDGPTDDQIANGPGMEGGVRYGK